MDDLRLGFQRRCCGYSGGGPQGCAARHNRTTRALLCPEAVHQEESAPPRRIVGECPDARLKERIGSVHTRIGRLFAVAASFMLVATALAVAKPPITLAAPPAHVTNPWAGAIQFKEPVWQGQVESFAQAMDTANPALATAARGAEAQPTAIWLDSKAAVSGPNGNATDLGAELNAAVAQQANTTTNPSGLPMVVNIVIYDLPGRDCAAYASNGDEVLTPVLTPADTAANDAVLADYKTNYISVIASYLASASYNNLRFALLIEPDSIGNALTNTVQNPYGTSADIAARCSLAAPYYEKGVEAALGAFHPISNAYTFLDITNSSWLVWRMLGNPTTQFDAGGEYAKLAVAAGGFQSVDGFVTNVSNYQPVKEPFITAAQSLGIYTVSGASAYGGQKDIDELGFIADMRTEFMAAGFPSTVGFAIDTSRAGWGGQARPTAASTISVTSQATLDAYVNASKIDKSPDSSDWCNQSGAGLGAMPAANPSIGIAGVSTPSYLWSFLWVKPPGQSDGSSNSGATGYDPNCDPAHVDPIKKIVSGALPNTPHAGTFNNTQFAELLLNAYPSVGAAASVPGAPTNVVASIVSGNVRISFTNATSGGAVANYLIWSSPSTNPPTPWNCGTSPCTISSGLAPSTTYPFTVTAQNTAGNSAAVSSNSVTTPDPALTPPGAVTNA